MKNRLSLLGDVYRVFIFVLVSARSILFPISSLVHFVYDKEDTRVANSRGHVGTHSDAKNTTKDGSVEAFSRP